jgi:sulfite reductase (NADPH) flavoprotein alpha-component
MQLADAGRQKDLRARFEAMQSAEQQAFLEQRQLADLAEEYPLDIDARALAGSLRPLSPRSYSIASSRLLADDEVHLTVATVSSNAIGVERVGAASGYLNRRLRPGAEVRVFVEPNRRFRLPQNRETPLVMIAAGTGIAPFRAFMQELEYAEARPEAWLIFGNPRRRTDFLYQREWLAWRESGLVSRIDAAWSRDQAEKRYVQHVVREQAERLERWLSRGAHLYLCGSLDMGKAVMAALEEGLAEQRQIDLAAAADSIKDLRRAGRIQKDLY